MLAPWHHYMQRGPFSKLEGGMGEVLRFSCGVKIGIETAGAGAAGVQVCRAVQPWPWVALGSTCAMSGGPRDNQ